MKYRLVIWTFLLVLLIGCGAGDPALFPSVPASSQAEKQNAGSEGACGLFTNRTESVAPAVVKEKGSFLNWKLQGIVPETREAEWDEWGNTDHAIFEGPVTLHGVVEFQSKKGKYCHRVVFFPSENSLLPKWSDCAEANTVILVPAPNITEQTRDTGFYDTITLRPREYYEKIENFFGFPGLSQKFECEIVMERFETNKTDGGVLTDVAFVSGLNVIEPSEGIASFCSYAKGSEAVVLHTGDRFGNYTLESIVEGTSDGTQKTYHANFTGEFVLQGELEIAPEYDSDESPISLYLRPEDMDLLPKWYMSRSSETVANIRIALEAPDDAPDDTKVYNQKIRSLFGDKRLPTRKYICQLKGSRFEAGRTEDGSSFGTVYLSPSDFSSVSVTDLSPTSGFFTDRCERIDPVSVRIGETFLDWTLTDVNDYSKWWQPGGQAIFEGNVTAQGTIFYEDAAPLGKRLVFIPKEGNLFPKWEQYENASIVLYPEEKIKDFLGILKPKETYPCEVLLTRYEIDRSFVLPAEYACVSGGKRLG